VINNNLIPISKDFKEFILSSMNSWWFTHINDLKVPETGTFFLPPYLIWTVTTTF
jgi:hypothetical protein